MSNSRRPWGVSLAILSILSACYPEPDAHEKTPRNPDAGAMNAGDDDASGGDSGAGTGKPSGARAGSGGKVEPVCGDGERQAAEACDDGNRTSGDGCDRDCRMEAPPEGPLCGDGEKSGEEQCDDGNLRSGDGCDRDCQRERCGNERVDAGEECDPPLAGTCSATCSRIRTSCGDGVVQEEAFETCDDKNTKAGDGCFECRKECGDGRIDGAIGEECDPFHSELCDPTTCKWLPSCGDGIIQRDKGEQCDPSNGRTCIDCRAVEPPPPAGCDAGAGGANGTNGSSGRTGDGACTEECTPEPPAERLQNGNFDTDFAGWTAHAPLVTLSSADQGSPVPKALEIELSRTTIRSASGAIQCLPITAGTKYEFRGQYFIPADAPEGVAASLTVFLYPGTHCSGTDFYRPPDNALIGMVRDAWTPYQYLIDTSPLAATGATEARMLFRLTVIEPKDVDGARVLWDSVSLLDLGTKCGDCSVDATEECDDGNQYSGDGCSAICKREICGDGVREPHEECDDGNTVFGAAGDQCTPSCHTATGCDTCSVTQCSAEATACFGLTGVAEAGPRAGTPRSTLCDALRSCVHESQCNKISRNSGGVEGPYFENCYCGTSGEACFMASNVANGTCRAEFEAALETNEPALVLQRSTGADRKYPIVNAVRTLTECEDAPAGCGASCLVLPACGDGFVQDRSYEGTLAINGQDVPCADELTHTGHGCRREECDDGNSEKGDGCDEHCFIEACGNNILQAGEDCEDGNTTGGDGCSPSCKSEFTCGNSVREPEGEHPIEVCDPPSTETGKVCTQAEFSADPTQCGCGGNCLHRIVCGDEILDSPAEQCDPPDGRRCGDDCRLLEQSACETCMLNDPIFIEVDMSKYCYNPPDKVPEWGSACIAVVDCFIQNECYLPISSTCYCGDDIDGCVEDSFVPNGPCADVVREQGLLGVNYSNQEVIGGLWFDNQLSPLGAATMVLELAITQCPTECFPYMYPPR